jgi:hypothetical protein
VDAAVQAGMPVRIAIVIFTGIKQNGHFVDMAPGSGIRQTPRRRI